MRIGLMISVLFSGAALLTASDWPRFRGPNGSGVAEGEALPSTLSPDEGVLWKTSLPTGKSSPALTEDRIYLTGHEDETLYTLALDSSTGRVLWRREAPSRRLEKMHRLNDEASASPVTDGQNVYVFFGGYGLLSYGPDGAERWRRPLGPFSNFHGMGASPVLVDDKLIMICDQDQDAYIVAVNKDSGETVWRSERPDMVHSFSTPTIYRPAEGPVEVIIAGSYQLVSYDAESGDELWRWRGLTYQVKSSPALGDGRIFLNTWAVGGEPGVRLVLPSFDEALAKLDKDSDGYIDRLEVPQEWQPGSWNMQDLDKDGRFDARDWQYYTQRRTSTNSTVSIRLGGRGDITSTHLEWQTQKNTPEVPSILLYQGKLILIKNGGILTTIDPGTGEILTQGRVRYAMDNYYASPVAGDGKVYLASEKGYVTVLDAASLKPHSTADFEEPIYATPAIHEGRIYLRTESALYAFGAD